MNLIFVKQRTLPLFSVCSNSMYMYYWIAKIIVLIFILVFSYMYLMRLTLNQGGWMLNKLTIRSALDFDKWYIWPITNLQLWKIPNSLALNFVHFPISLYSALLLKKIKIVLKWPRSPSTINPGMTSHCFKILGIVCLVLKALIKALIERNQNICREREGVPMPNLVILLYKFKNFEISRPTPSRSANVMGVLKSLAAGVRVVAGLYKQYLL